MNNANYFTFMSFLSDNHNIETKDTKINPTQSCTFMGSTDMDFASEKQKELLLNKYGSTAYLTALEESLQTITDIYRAGIFTRSYVFDDHGNIRQDRNKLEDGSTQPIEQPSSFLKKWTPEKDSVFLYHYRKYFLSATYVPSIVMKVNPMAVFPVLFSSMDKGMLSGYNKITASQNLKHDFLNFQRKCMEDHLPRDIANIVFQYAWPTTPFNHGLITELRTILMYLAYIASNLASYYSARYIVIPLLRKAVDNEHDLSMEITITQYYKEISIICHTIPSFPSITISSSTMLCDGYSCSKECSNITRVLETSLYQFKTDAYAPLCKLMAHQDESNVFKPFIFSGEDFGKPDNLAMLLFGWGELSGYDWAYYVFMHLHELAHGDDVWLNTYRKDAEWQSVMSFIDSLFGKEEKNKGRKRKGVSS